ncbi:MAG TPA: hypothetical protein PKD49_08165 [Hyphomicrobium sp.]|nr:hypothetical protein [Hyphomicrobium sp.]
MSLAEIYRAWGVLLALSLTTIGLTLVDGPYRIVSGGLLLVLAGLKARTILARYLELGHSAFWMKLFGLVIWLFLLIAFAVYVIGSGRTP